jgi:hypothetical protein
MRLRALSAQGQAAAQNSRHDGSWMRASDYRTSLEKTTITSHSEPAKSRER